MFDHSAFEVAGYAGIEGAGTAGKDVDGVVVHERTGKSRFLTRQKTAGSE